MVLQDAVVFSWYCCPVLWVVNSAVVCNTIKFTATWSAEETIFLDTRIYLKEYHIETNLYVKPIATHQYLHINSCHPKHCKTAIPYGQALRLREIFSEEENLQKRAEELKRYLLKRGYPAENLGAEINQALSVPRDGSLLQQVQKKTDRTPLVITYNPTLPSIGRITRRQHNILHASKRPKQAIPSPPIIAFRRPKSQRDLLVRVELKTSEHSPPGNHRYGSSRCKTCPILRTIAEFTSHSSGQQYQLKTTASCKTMNVVYMMQCKKCGQQYVGDTGQALHCRMNNHRADIIHKKIEDKPVAAHFSTKRHSVEDMEVMVI